MVGHCIEGLFEIKVNEASLCLTISLGRNTSLKSLAMPIEFLVSFADLFQQSIIL